MTGNRVTATRLTITIFIVVHLPSRGDTQVHVAKMMYVFLRMQELKVTRRPVVGTVGLMYRYQVLIHQGNIHSRKLQAQFLEYSAKILMLFAHFVNKRVSFRSLVAQYQ